MIVARNFSYAEDYDSQSLIRWQDGVLSKDILVWHLCALYNWKLSWTDLDKLCSSQELIDSTKETALVSNDIVKPKRVWNDFHKDKEAVGLSVERFVTIEMDIPILNEYSNLL